MKDGFGAFMYSDGNKERGPWHQHPNYSNLCWAGGCTFEERHKEETKKVERTWTGEEVEINISVGGDSARTIQSMQKKKTVTTTTTTTKKTKVTKKKVKPKILVTPRGGNTGKNNNQKEAVESSDGPISSIL